jgi:hypothetical protein
MTAKKLKTYRVNTVTGKDVEFEAERVVRTTDPTPNVTFFIGDEEVASFNGYTEFYPV